jgi:hypothetical protein
VAGDDVYVTAITAFEVTRGLKPREREPATRLFEGLLTADLGIGEGRLAGWWAQRYASRGRTLAQADLLIAAAAVGLGARLATANPKDFPMREASVEHRPSGVQPGPNLRLLSINRTTVSIAHHERTKRSNRHVVRHPFPRRGRVGRRR